MHLHRSKSGSNVSHIVGMIRFEIIVQVHIHCTSEMSISPFKIFCFSLEYDIFWGNAIIGREKKITNSI